MTNLHSVLLVAVVAAVTILIRFLPFLIFGSDKKTPEFIAWLGKVLPYAIMGMLVVYCLKDISIASSPFGIPELIGCVVAAGLYIWKRNTLISIVLSTVLYMVLIQTVFA